MAPGSSAALAVLTDAFVLLHITSFQRGLPHDVVELARAHLAIDPTFHKRTGRKGRLLPALAIKAHDLKLLQRLYRYYRQQPVYQTDPRYMTFRYTWRDCLEYGGIAVVMWAASQPLLMAEPARRIGFKNKNTTRCELLTHAFGNKNEEAATWLLATRPEYKTAVWACHLRAVWLEANVPSLPYDASAMDEAACAGDLDMIQYLHDTRTTTGCTTKAMDKAGKHGHLEVVRFLHEHRTEGCTVRANDRASNLQVLRFLLDNRTEGCTRNAMDRAATHGKLDILRYLHENRTEECTTRAMEGAARGGHLEIVRFLHENRTEECSTLVWDAAALNGHLAVVQFVYSKCKVRDMRRGIEWAAGGGHLAVERYLHTHGFRSGTTQHEAPRT